MRLQLPLTSHVCRSILMQASSYMRAVLRTIAQCHNNRILHRDVKPGNFMLLSDSPKAPLKAIGAPLTPRAFNGHGEKV